MEQSKTLLWGVIGIVILGALGLGWYYFAGTSAGTNPVDNSTYSQDVNSDMSSTTNDQNTASSSVDHRYDNYQPSGS